MTASLTAEKLAEIERRDDLLLAVSDVVIMLAERANVRANADRIRQHRKAFHAAHRAATSAPAEASVRRGIPCGALPSGNCHENYCDRCDGNPPGTDAETLPAAKGTASDWQPTDEQVRECAAWIYRGSWSKDIETARAVISPLAINHYWLRSARAALRYAHGLFGEEAERLQAWIDQALHWEKEARALRAQLAARPTAPLPAVPKELLEALERTYNEGTITCEADALSHGSLLALLRAAPPAPAAADPEAVEIVRNLRHGAETMTWAEYAAYHRKTITKALVYVRKAAARAPTPPPLPDGVRPFDAQAEIVKLRVDVREMAERLVFLGDNVPHTWNKVQEKVRWLNSVRAIASRLAEKRS